MPDMEPEADASEAIVEAPPVEATVSE
jgi:hypothetical protein